MIDLGQAQKQKVIPIRPKIKVVEDPIESFKAHCSCFGLNIGEVITSAQIIRFDVDDRGDKAGWYIFYFDDICGAVFGNWKTGLNEKWCSKSRKKMTDAESAKYQKMCQDAKAKRKKAEKENNKEAQIRTKKIWEDAEPANQDHPYLVKKKILAHDLRQSNGNLIVPEYDENGELWSVQFISRDGEKKFIKNGRQKGCSYTISGNDDFFLCEGFATGASIHAATGGTVVCAFSSGNLLRVAEVLRKAKPTNNITICADNDRFTTDNPGVKAAKEAAMKISARVVFPDFIGVPGCDDPELKLTDFNDLAITSNLDVVARQIKNGSTGGNTKFPPQGPSQTNLLETVQKRPPSRKYIFKYNDQGLIPRGIVGVLTAAGGTGKTFFLLQMGMAAANGGSFGPINTTKPQKTLVICGEDSQEEMVRRAWDIAKGKFSEKFHAISTRGELGPLMRLDGNIPTYAEAYYWLENTIGLHPGLDLLILDPMSRFYGLDENSNDHATQWIKGLERLSKRFGDLTILFSHHVGKDSTNRLHQGMSRGASALVDGCRWQGGLVRMDPKDAEKLGIENPRDYIVFDAPKMNYAPDTPARTFFQRGDGGVLEYVEPWNDRAGDLGNILFEMLKKDHEEYSFLDLVKHSKGKDVAREMVEKFPSFKRGQDMKIAINHLLRDGKLIEKEIGNNRTILKVKRSFF